MTGDVLIDRYVLGALLGKGGMGYVHEAVDLKMQRPVAVKLLGAISPDGESLRRFSREALAAGSLQHPNVVGVFDTGEQQGRPFLVTELLRGETLRQVLQRGTPPVEQARAWAKQLAAGLAAAHDKGLTHRDLKPSNIFITSDGWVKILDFGLAKLTEALQPSPDSDAYRTLGTIGYMAPEQVRGQPVDARADLFNFGLVLYELLAGKAAFADGSDTDTSYAIVVREPAPLPLEVPRQLRSLVASCLAKDREKRPPSAREVLRLLEMPETAAPQPSRLRIWALPAMALLMLALALLTVAVRRPLTSGGPLSGAVAIFPFDARSAQAQAVLAAGVSDLLSRDLAGARLRALDPATVRQVANDGAVTQTIDRARARGLQLSARYFVLGRVEERSGELRISAVLHDTESAKPLVFADVRGKPEEILRLVCELAVKLERRKVPPAELEARIAALQSQTTASLPALQAWLEGWQMWRAARWPEMYAALRRAVDIDPDFTLGLYDLGQMTMMREQDTAENLLTRAMRHPERLSSAERLHARNYLLRLQGSQQEAAQLLFDAVREHPDDAMIWRYLVGWIFHHGALLGHSPQEAADASQRQLQLEPLDLDPMVHLLDLAQLRGERPAVLRISERLLGIADSNPEDTLGFQVAHAWASGNAAEHDAMMAKLAGAPATTIRQALSRVEMQMDGSPDAVDLASRLPFEPGLQPLPQVDLFHGQIHEARRAMAEAIAAHPGGDTPYYLPWIDTLELVQAAPAELAASRAAAAGLDVTADPTRAPAKQYLIGLLALRARDLEAAREALLALQATPEIPRSSIAADLSLSLQARILAARGDHKGALLLLDQQKLRIPERYYFFYSRAREHFFRASLLTALGRPREALPLYEALAVYDLVDRTFFPAAQLYTARIYDSLGETERAIEHYERFTAMWKECDPQVQPEVAIAQARLRHLRETR